MSHSISLFQNGHFTLPDENSVAVLVNCHKRPEPVAKLAFDCTIKIKACIIDNNIPVPATAVGTEVRNASEFFAVFREVVFHSHVHFNVRINCS